MQYRSIGETVQEEDRKANKIYPVIFEEYSSGLMQQITQLLNNSITGEGSKGREMSLLTFNFLLGWSYVR